MIRAIIVEDEAHCLKDIQNLLGFYSEQIEVVGNANTLINVKELIETLNPDVVFLDIQVGSSNSIAWLKTLDKIDFQIIFTTGYDHYAIEAFKFSAIDYLLKPINPDELEAAINKLYKSKSQHSLKYEALHSNHQSKETPQKIVLSDADNIHLIEVKDIVRCQASNNYTIFFLVNEKQLLISKPLKEYADMLEGKDFFRTHKSHLINLSYFQRYDKREGGSIILKDDTSIPVANRRKEDLMQYLHEMGR